jgi:hypothetical protein
MMALEKQVHEVALSSLVEFIFIDRILEDCDFSSAPPAGYLTVVLYPF